MKATAASRSSRIPSGISSGMRSSLSPAAFTKAVAGALAAVADPAARKGMRAYMRDQFDYLGVKTPALRTTVDELIRGQKDASAADLLRCARALWALPQREFQYVAVGLLSRHADRLTPAHIPALFVLVRKKSWWDTVDSLAG